MQKLLTFFSKTISVYTVINDQSFNDTLTNGIVSFEQLGPGHHKTLPNLKNLNMSILLPTVRAANNLDPDQTMQPVWASDLGLYCFLRLVYSKSKGKYDKYRLCP